MTKERRVIIPPKTGSYHDKIECAIRTDGSSPAADFLDELKADAWPRGEPQPIDPDNAPSHVLYRLLAVMTHLARCGKPPFRTAINFLEDGIWEVKGDVGRLPYFDVDTETELHEPKNWIEDRSTVDPEGKDPLFWYPKMAGTLRLTHGFLKDGDKTRDEHIVLALDIRDEDLEDD